MPRLTREQSREITREKLRLSAIDEISTNGFQGASIDRICEAAGFSRGAFYANFSSKEELLLDILRTHYNREAESWIALLKSGRTLEELFPLLRDKFSAYLSDERRILFVAELQLYARRNRAFFDRYNQDFLVVNFKAEQILEALFHKAGKRPHRPLPVLARMMRGLVSGLALDTDSHSETAAASADLLTLFLEDLIRSPPA